MLCDRIVDVAELPTIQIDDDVDLEWWELQRRAVRKTSRGGLHVRILLPLGIALFDGAVVSDGSRKQAIRIHLLPCAVLKILARDARELANLALELGNLHAPSEVIEGGVLTIADGPVEAMLGEMGLAGERLEAKFHPRRCVGMPEVRVAADLRVIAS